MIADFEEEGSPLSAQKMNAVNQSIKIFPTLKFSTLVSFLLPCKWLPIFQVPTNTETASGSLRWECLDFISWRSWQKESHFWKRSKWVMVGGNKGFHVTADLSVLPYPCTLKCHLLWCVVMTVNHHSYLGWTALKLDNLKNWYVGITRQIAYTVMVSHKQRKCFR